MLMLLHVTCVTVTGGGGACPAASASTLSCTHTRPPVRTNAAPAACSLFAASAPAVLHVPEPTRTALQLLFC